MRNLTPCQVFGLPIIGHRVCEMERRRGEGRGGEGRRGEERERWGWGG